MKAIDQACPDQIQRLLVELRTIECQLGNIQTDSDWNHPGSLEELNHKAFGDLSEAEFETERLFAMISNKLHEAGKSAKEIAHIFNLYLTPNGRMPYCNEQEVHSVLTIR